MGKILIEIAITVAMLALPVICGLLGRKFVKIKEKVANNKIVQECAKIAVGAAEQLGRSGVIDYNMKFNDAIIRLKKMLTDNGIDAKYYNIESCIESCVNEFNKGANPDKHESDDVSDDEKESE